MGRTTKPLTTTEIKAAKPKDKEYVLVDGEGLRLRVHPNGSKKWLFNYQRPFIKKRTQIGLGSFPETSLSEAREFRREYRVLLAQDVDPKEHRDRQRREAEGAHLNTFQYIASLWFEVKRESLTEDYAFDVWSSLENHLFPMIGDVPIHKITAPLAIEALQPLAKQRKLESVKRLCQRANEVMTYAVNAGLIQANPLMGIRSVFKSPKKEHLPTLRPDELGELLKRVSESKSRIITKAMFEWQLHTMSRPGEASTARWDELDLERNVWVIPASKMKMGKTHTIPLTPQCLKILDTVRPISGHTEWIFVSDSDLNKRASSATVNKMLRKCGYKNRLVAHGLRSLASTALNESGLFDPDLIEAALSHMDKNEVRRAYNRADYLKRRRAMMAWWSDHIQQSGGQAHVYGCI
ncbi:integrase domain-containing protein [Dongshaea marina]|uniref:integrase domain-containing protein n=1 Tax=Dongshaea marina TaxID=2047966 RepID=UPI000D3E4AAB|nr:integrase domain-containing protein [Dongshaea marina]